MRTTVRLDDDVARAVDELRRTQGLGTSEAINLLARRGLAEPEPSPIRFAQTTSSMGRPKVPLDDVGGALEVLEGEDHRC